MDRLFENFRPLRNLIDVVILYQSGSINEKLKQLVKKNLHSRKNSEIRNLPKKGSNNIIKLDIRELNIGDMELLPVFWNDSSWNYYFNLKMAGKYFSNHLTMCTNTTDVHKPILESFLT